MERRRRGLRRNSRAAAAASATGGDKAVVAAASTVGGAVAPYNPSTSRVIHGIGAFLAAVGAGFDVRRCGNATKRDGVTDSAPSQHLRQQKSSPGNKGSSPMLGRRRHESDNPAPPPFPDFNPILQQQQVQLLSSEVASLMQQHGSPRERSSSSGSGTLALGPPPVLCKPVLPLAAPGGANNMIYYPIQPLQLPNQEIGADHPHFNIPYEAAPAAPPPGPPFTLAPALSASVLPPFLSDSQQQQQQPFLLGRFLRSSGGAGAGSSSSRKFSHPLQSAVALHGLPPGNSSSGDLHANVYMNPAGLAPVPTSTGGLIIQPQASALWHPVFSDAHHLPPGTAANRDDSSSRAAYATPRSPAAVTSATTSSTAASAVKAPFSAYRESPYFFGTFGRSGGRRSESAGPHQQQAISSSSGNRLRASGGRDGPPSSSGAPRPQPSDRFVTFVKAPKSSAPPSSSQQRKHLEPLPSPLQKQQHHFMKLNLTTPTLERKKKPAPALGAHFRAQSYDEATLHQSPRTTSPSQAMMSDTDTSTAIYRHQQHQLPPPIPPRLHGESVKLPSDPPPMLPHYQQQQQQHPQQRYMFIPIPSTATTTTASVSSASCLSSQGMVSKSTSVNTKLRLPLDISPLPVSPIRHSSRGSLSCSPNASRKTILLPPDKNTWQQQQQHQHHYYQPPPLDSMTVDASGGNQSTTAFFNNPMYSNIQPNQSGQQQQYYVLAPPPLQQSLAGQALPVADVDNYLARIGFAPVTGGVAPPPVPALRNTTSSPLLQQHPTTLQQQYLQYVYFLQQQQQQQHYAQLSGDTSLTGADPARPERPHTLDIERRKAPGTAAYCSSNEDDTKSPLSGLSTAITTCTTATTESSLFSCTPGESGISTGGSSCHLLSSGGGGVYSKYSPFGAHPSSISDNEDSGATCNPHLHPGSTGVPAAGCPSATQWRAAMLPPRAFSTSSSHDPIPFADGGGGGERWQHQQQRPLSRMVSPQAVSPHRNRRYLVHQSKSVDRKAGTPGSSGITGGVGGGSSSRDNSNSPSPGFQRNWSKPTLATHPETVVESPQTPST